MKALFMADRFLDIDFMTFLRAAEPAIDQLLPGERLPALRDVIVVGSDVPRSGRSFDQFCSRERRVGQQLDRLAHAVQPADLLLIQFTSGTTAYPKAVMLTHDNMLRNAWAVGLRLGIAGPRPLFQLPAVLPRRRHHALAARVAHAGSCLVTLPTFEAGAALRDDGATSASRSSRAMTPFPAHDGTSGLRPAALSLRGGWAAAGPETVSNIIEKHGRARYLRGLRLVGSLSQCRAQ